MRVDQSGGWDPTQLLTEILTSREWTAECWQILFHAEILLGCGLWTVVTT